MPHGTRRAHALGAAWVNTPETAPAEPPGSRRTSLEGPRGQATNEPLKRRCIFFVACRGLGPSGRGVGS
jgi:hypothetical protein